MSANCHHQGDCTVFKGYFQVDKPLDKETADIIDALKTGRCVARDVIKLSAILEMSVKDCQRRYGKQGQYYVGSDVTSKLPPGGKSWLRNDDFAGQPACGRQGWDYHAKDHTIRADGDEKFYEYTEWIVLLVRDVLAPRGYIVNGSVEYENRPWREGKYDENGNYIEPEEEEDFDEETRNEETDVWGTIEICNNVVYADHPEWHG